MRLTESEIRAIREELARLYPDAQVYLFGSRADDDVRGGDIDLLVVSDKLAFRDLVRLRVRILDRIGWQTTRLGSPALQSVGRPSGGCGPRKRNQVVNRDQAPRLLEPFATVLFCTVNNYCQFRRSAVSHGFSHGAVFKAYLTQQRG